MSKEIQILCSKSNQGNNKKLFEYFRPIMYETLEDLAAAMMKTGHCHAILGTEYVYRYNAATRCTEWHWKQIKRLTNISYLGNLFIYDFDDGKWTFKQAVKAAKKIKKKLGFNCLIIYSKSNPKYDYDRFKLIVVTDNLWVLKANKNADLVPEPFTKRIYDSKALEENNGYWQYYTGLAKDFGFSEVIDRTGKDVVRLMAQVTSSDKKDKRRDYVVIR